MRSGITGTPRPKVSLSDSDLLSQVSGWKLAAGRLYKNDKWIKKIWFMNRIITKSCFCLILHFAWALRRRVDLILFDNPDCAAWEGRISFLQIFYTSGVWILLSFNLLIYNILCDNRNYFKYGPQTRSFHGSDPEWVKSE